MQFDLTDLRLFVATAESLSLTRGSARQHLSLAAASSRVKALETRSGTALLERGARGVRLTPAGEAFLHHARALLRQTEQLRAELREYSGGLRGHVRVFANTTAVTDFLPDILPTYLAAHPKINIDLQEKPNGEIARGVRESRADIGIVAGQVDTTGLTATHFNTDRLVLVVPRGHALARRKAVAFAETLEEDHVGMHASSTLHAYLTDIAQRLDRPLKLLGDAFGPVALVLVGVTLAQSAIGAQLRGALVISAIKTLLHPALMAGAGWLAGLRGLPLAVMVVAASLPVGANVFLFSQRYRKAEDLVTASVAVSTALALLSVSLVMALLPKLPA